MFSSLNLFHSQRYYRNLWPRGFLEARQEWSHKHLPQKCETFFIQTQNSMFSRPSETSNIGIDQFTNRPIEYCEFVIMSILLFLETLTFKLFLGHGQHLQVLWCLSVFLTFISVQRYFSLEGSLFKASKRWRQFSQKCLYIVYWFINSQKALREAPFPPRWNNHFKIKSESWFPRCFYWVRVFLDFWFVTLRPCDSWQFLRNVEESEFV